MDMHDSLRRTVLTFVLTGLAAGCAVKPDANGMNHERHLCQVMAQAEPDASLKKFLLDAEKRYDGLYDRVTALLDKDYFKDPNGKTND